MLKGQPMGANERPTAEQLSKHLEARQPLPSRYTTQGADVFVWLKEKAEHETRLGAGEGNLWLVHGKWYDLAEFAKVHPGGPDWLLLTRGQDVTEAFEVHHLNVPKAQHELDKYYVKDASVDYVGRYPWLEQGFYRTLKRRVVAHFQAASTTGRIIDATGPTPFFVALCSTAVAVHMMNFVALLCWPCWTLALLAGFTLQPFHGIGHNFLHVRDNMWMYCYDFCGWKHHKHRISHALSHHLHPNTRIDLEHAEPWSFTFTCNSFRNTPWIVLTGPLTIWTNTIRDIFELWRSLAMGREPWRHEYLFNMVQLALLVMTAGPVRGFALFCVVHFICGLCIETAGYALHRSVFAWSHGDPNAKYDYGEHVLAATADHDVDMSLVLSLYLFQILNNHGIHHLFPTVDKSRIAEIMPIFRETCKEFSVPWQEYSWRDMFCSLWKNWTTGMFMDTPMLTKEPMGHLEPNASELRITPIEGQTLGAVVTGVQVPKLTSEELRAIKKAWCEHGVLVIKDQNLTPHEEVAFAKNFPHSRTCDDRKYHGPLAKEDFDAEVWRKFKLKSCPEIQLRGFKKLEDHHGVTGMIDTGKGAKEFHSDSLHEYDTPPIGTTLYCIESPGEYDHTLFMDTRLAYDLLTSAERERADSLFVQYKQEPSPLHESGLKADFGAGLDTLGDLYGSCVQDNPNSDNIQVSQVHPLVWTHPVTGRRAIITAAMWMHRIVEEDGTPWTPDASHDYVYRLLKPAAERVYAHSWSTNDLVVFDNRSLMHSASPVPKQQKDRLLHQIIACGNQVPMGPAGVGVGNPAVNPNVQAVR